MENVERSATLETAGISVYLTLTEPVYDDIFFTLTYQAKVDNILAFDESITAAPTAFDRATLYVSLDEIFQAQLYQANIDRTNEGRPDLNRPPNSPQCCEDPSAIRAPAGGGAAGTPEEGDTAEDAVEVEPTPTSDKR